MLKELESQRIVLVRQDHQGDLWVGNERGGLYCISSEGWHSVGLGLGAPVCCEEDREGDLWVGCDLGLAQVHRLAVRTFTTRDGLTDNNALSVCETTDGAIWAGTAHGLNCIRHEQVTAFLDQEPFPDCSIPSVCPGARGGVVVSKPALELLEFEGGKFLYRQGRPVLPGIVNALYQDDSHRLWLGTESGAFAFAPGEFVRPCLAFTNAPLRDVRSILKARDGTLWFGTAKQGLVRSRQGKLTVLKRQDGLSNNSVWSLLEDEEGTLWIATDHGFNRYRNGRLFAFSSRHGLPESTINCVLEDDAGDLWLSGLHGIHQAHRQELNAVADGHAASAQFLTVGVADGMENPETNGGENQPAGWKARDGRLWFPTVQGVVAIDPKRFLHDEIAPPALLEQVIVDGEEVLGGQPSSIHKSTDAAIQQSIAPLPIFRLPAGHGRAVEFRYAANTFVAPELGRFRYRLVGLDRDWREETVDCTARYTDLRPGRYRFEVMAANHHHVWNPHPAGFAFTLAPFFWHAPRYVHRCNQAQLPLTE